MPKCKRYGFPTKKWLVSHFSGYVYVVVYNVIVLGSPTKTLPGWYQIAAWREMEWKMVTTCIIDMLRAKTRVAALGIIFAVFIFAVINIQRIHCLFLSQRECQSMFQRNWSLGIQERRCGTTRIHLRIPNWTISKHWNVIYYLAYQFIANIANDAPNHQLSTMRIFGFDSLQTIINFSISNLKTITICVHIARRRS